MNFKKYFESRQGYYHYTSVVQSAVIAIVLLHSIYIAVFMVCYFSGFKGFKNILFAPFLAIAITIILSFILKNHKIKTNIMMFWTHILISLMNYFGTIYLGWDFGFYFLTMMAIGFNYIHNFKNGTINIIMSFLELVLFIFLLINFKHKTPAIQSSENIQIFFHVLHFLYICFAILIFANITNISRKIAIGNIQNKKKELEQQANNDFLTGLANRRLGSEYLNSLIQALKKKKIESFVFCIGDLDNFKQINDKYGHNFGDKTLKEIAIIIKNNLNEINDVCVRWGGEEFVILIANSPFEKSLNQIERIRHQIQNHTIKSDECQTQVSISFGFVYVENVCAFDDIVKKADSLLYNAKSSGKNKTICEMI